MKMKKKIRLSFQGIHRATKLQSKLVPILLPPHDTCRASTAALSNYNTTQLDSEESPASRPKACKSFPSTRSRLCDDPVMSCLEHVLKAARRTFLDPRSSEARRK